MIELIKSISKTDPFFKTRKNIVVKSVKTLTNKMFPSSVSFKNASKFVSDYDPTGTKEMVFLTYKIKQNKGTAKSPKWGEAKGFQLFLKLHDDLIVVLDRRESGRAGAGQIILRYIDGDGTKQGGVQFHGAQLFDGLAKKYDKEIEKMSVEHSLNPETSEEVRDIFLF